MRFQANRQKLPNMPLQPTRKRRAAAERQAVSQNHAYFERQSVDVLSGYRKSDHEAHFLQ